MQNGNCGARINCDISAVSLGWTNFFITRIAKDVWILKRKKEYKRVRLRFSREITKQMFLAVIVGVHYRVSPWEIEAYMVPGSGTAGATAS